MWLSDLSIRRPVLATVMSIILVVLGLVGLTRLSVREYPDIDPPVVSVTTVYEGASPEVIETTITEPLEDEITSIEGIKSLSSSSAEGFSTIIATFELTRDIDEATQDVRDRVARAREQLPESINDPLIVKQDADAQPIMWLGLANAKNARAEEGSNGDAAAQGKNTDERFSQLQLTDYADRFIIDQLQTVPSVGRVVIGGQREYAMRLWLDPSKMAARAITPLDVRDALVANNIELPSGRIEGADKEYTLRTLGEMSNEAEFNRLIIKTVNGVPIRLRDIGTAKIGARTTRSLVRMNGKTAVGLGVVKQSKANTLDVASRIKEKSAQLAKKLPRGMTLEVGYDGSKAIAQSIQEVRESLIQAIALVSIVIFLFLGNLRATLVPVITIPISLVATFFVMDMLGYSINILTLLALTLAIGLVVDDAIVVLETIYRRIEEGDPPLVAAREGMKEIGFAVIATTLVLIAIFVPLTFMGGTVGRLFSEFAIALAGAVVISTFVALSLSPTMCGRFLDPVANITRQWAYRFTQPFRSFIDSLRDRYLSTLDWALNHRLAVLAGTMVLLILTAGVYVIIPKEFLPTEDKGFVLTAIRAPEGATIGYTNKAARQAEAVFSSRDDVKRFFTVLAFSQTGIGAVNEGIMFVTLKDKGVFGGGERTLGQAEVLGEVLPQMMSIPEAMVFPFAPPSGPTGSFGDPFKLVIQGFDLQQIAEVSEAIKAEMNSMFGFYNIQNSLKLNKPQLRIHVNRERASQLGVNVRDLTQTLLILTGGIDVSSFQLNNKRYDVMLQAPDNLRLNPAALANYYVRTDSNTMLPLTSVAVVEETIAPKELPHYNRLRSATLTAGIIPVPGLSLGGMMEQVEAKLDGLLGGELDYAWAGESLELKETQSTTQFAFLLAILMVFLVLAGQFESYMAPLMIILTVPLAVCGAMFSLYLFGASWNTYSQIGLILLVGLVTKNGILLIEYANALRQNFIEGDDSQPSAAEIITKACAIRFRPIMMTAISTIAGSLPLVLGVGVGAQSRQALGVAVIGGMGFATLLTLFVLPIIYTYLQRNTASQPETL